MNILDLIEKWKIIATTNITCKEDPWKTIEEKQLSKKQCINHAKSDENVNFVFVYRFLSLTRFLSFRNRNQC